jgi:MscS family membrane protein
MIWHADNTGHIYRGTQASMKTIVVSGDRTKQMSLLRKNRQGIGPLLKKTYTLGIALAVLFLTGSALYSPAQLPKSTTPPAKAEPTAALDPLGRETPRGTVIGFLKYEQRGDHVTAARYLQLPPGQGPSLVDLVKEFRVLSPSFQSNINLLSDDPNGTVESGLPPGQVRAGVMTIGGKTTDVILVRVDDPTAGKIWLVSQGTLASIPKLYAEVESEAPTTADRIRLAVLRGPQLLGMSSTQWLGWLLSIPISWLLAWVLTILLSTPRRVWCKLRKLPFSTVWDTPVGMPLRCMIAILLHGCFVYLLQPPLLYRVYYVRFLAAILAGCFGWLASRLSDQGFDRALNRTRTRHHGGESILILMQKLNRVGILIIALAAILALLGLNVTAALTGLGIGGLAVALAAQKSLENLIGGVSLLMDKALQVGDFCKIGERVGTVEDIGLRSLKVRTLDQNLLVVPNGLLAQMQFENMKLRPKLLLQQTFLLRIETQVEQLRFVLDGVQRMLDENPMIESGSSRLRVISFAGAAFELELFAFGKTGDFREFTGIRQEIILKIAGIVEAAGTRFAAPTRLTYLSTDAVVDVERANNIVHNVTEPRSGNEFRLPGEVQTETK